MTRIEAIRQRAAKAYPRGVSDIRHDGTPVYTQMGNPVEDVVDLLTLWDTRETALRALVDKADHLIRDVKADGRMTHQLRDLRDSLSRLLEQEP